jgi:hypothetical protein
MVGGVGVGVGVGVDVGVGVGDIELRVTAKCPQRDCKGSGRMCDRSALSEKLPIPTSVEDFIDRIFKRT